MDKNNKAPQNFWFYSPAKTFNKENTEKLFLNSDSKPIKSLEPGLDDVDLETIHLPSYFSKGLLCFEKLSDIIIEKNPGIEICDELFDDILMQLEDEIIFAMKELIDKKKASFIDSENNKKVNIIDYIKSLSTIDGKFSPIYQSQVFVGLKGFYEEYVFPLAALQHLDTIILAEYTSGSGSNSAYESASSFHDCYFMSVKKDEIIKQSKKGMTETAVKAKVDKTSKRNEFIISTWKSTNMTKKEFSLSNEHIQVINQYSSSIGIAPLTPTGAGDKIYRLLLSDAKS